MEEDLIRVSFKLWRKKFSGEKTSAVFEAAAAFLSLVTRQHECPVCGLEVAEIRSIIEHWDGEVKHMNTRRSFCGTLQSVSEHINTTEAVSWSYLQIEHKIRMPFILKGEKGVQLPLGKKKKKSQCKKQNRNAFTSRGMFS